MVASTENSNYWVSARSPGASFTIKTNTAVPAGSGVACLSFVIVN